MKRASFDGLACIQTNAARDGPRRKMEAGYFIRRGLMRLCAIRLW
jgi:hypothetical protein